MRAVEYGEDQPRLQDDRLPVVLVILDGLGDRAIPELGMRTPAEAAHTPVLDRLTRRGASGWHVPFGWGRAPSSELAHWALFGYAQVPFPGRAVLEGLGAGLELAPGVATTFASLRTSQVVDGTVRITGRAASDDMEDAQQLLAELTPYFAGREIRMQNLGRGEALLQFDRHESGQVTDSDPFFEHLHPWLRVQAIEGVAREFADELNRTLLQTRQLLQGSAINRARQKRGKPALDVLSTKWSGSLQPLPAFVDLAGVPGAAITDSRLYRGLARLLEMKMEHRAPRTAHADDIAERIALAEDMIAAGAGFVHIHTKATDEAGHTKDPYAKLQVLESLDAGLTGLEQLADRAIVAVTGDHATPSVHGVLHTGDPTPLLLAGPTVRTDEVEEFGESNARRGWYGMVKAEEMLPLLFSHANRPLFLGHRMTPVPTLALPNRADPMPVD